METIVGLSSLVAVVAVAAIVPVIGGLLPGPRIPQVVLLIIGGVLIGPEMLDRASISDIELFGNVGLGFLFLLAGYEIEAGLFRSGAGRLAMKGWFTSVTVAVILVGSLSAAGLVSSFIPVSLALTTTALGTLLPILRDHDMLGGSFGKFVMASGAVGELFPVFAIALFLGASTEFVAILSLLAVGTVAVVLILAPRVIKSERIARVFAEGEHSTSQLTLRWAMLLLIGLLWIAADLGVDVILGAFLAGMVLRRWAPGDVESLELKLDAVGYGVFIPIFFIWSGMKLDVDALIDAPFALIVFMMLMLAIRGLPTLFIYRRALPLAERWELTFISATALPLLVALTEIGVQNGTMSTENAAVLVGAGCLSVLIFPLTAIAIDKRRRAAEPDIHSARLSGS